MQNVTLDEGEPQQSRKGFADGRLAAAADAHDDDRLRGGWQIF
jgi:hypothetical protein